MSVLPQRQSLLIETFPRHDRHHLCVFGFAGRNAQQTLGLLLTKRMEEEGWPRLVCVDGLRALIWGWTLCTILRHCSTPKN